MDYAPDLDTKDKQYGKSAQPFFWHFLLPSRSSEKKKNYTDNYNMGHQHAIVRSLQHCWNYVCSGDHFRRCFTGLPKVKCQKNIPSIRDKHKQDPFYNVFHRAITLAIQLNYLTLTVSEMKGRPKRLRKKKKETEETEFLSSSLREKQRTT